MHIPPPGIQENRFLGPVSAEPGLTIGMEYRPGDFLQLRGEPETEDFHVRYRSQAIHFGTGSRQG